MRTAVVVALTAIVLALAPSSSAGVFPDLPGADMLEESIADQSPASATTSGDAPEPSDDRVPAPDPSSVTPDPSAVTKEAAGAEEIEVVTSLPGGGGLPILKDFGRTAQQSGSTAPLVIFAGLVVLAFTRFLFRLNELGRRAV
jgi:hypothetical protein